LKLLIAPKGIEIIYWQNKKQFQCSFNRTKRD